MRLKKRKMEIPKQLQNPDFRFLILREKDKKPIAEMTSWQKDNFQFDNPFLQHHLNGGKNYGIIGGFGNLILIDADSEEVEEIAETLPETFTIKTGSPEEYKKHYYYICDKAIKGIRLSKEKVGDLGDIRGVGQYVVAPNSTHPSGNDYQVLRNVGIKRITEEEIKNAFKYYIEKGNDSEQQSFKIETKLRNSRFVRECGIPDYVINNKLKSETSKNWKLFPYLVDILHAREVSQQTYINLCKSQGHDIGAIKGWVKMAHEGKLAKTSCKKMREYLERFHPELVKEICGNCPLYKRAKVKKDITENVNYSKLQKNVFILLLDNDRNKATEVIVNEIKKDNYIYTTRDDIKSEMWIYDEGVYIPQGKTFVKEFSRKILGNAFTTQLSNIIINKIEADTYINQDEFFKTDNISEIPLMNGILNIFTETF